MGRTLHARAVWGMTLLPWIVACAGQEPDVEGTGSTGGSEAGDGTEHGDTASTDQADGSSDDGASSSDTADTADTDDTGEPPAAGPDRVGIFSAAHNYYELDVEGGPLRFHFGAENSRWGAATLPVAGDFDGDGFDTVGRYDPLARRFHLADDNDSDELSPRGQVHAIVGVPPAPAVSGEQPAELPVAGDWDGDGADGVGVYHPGTHTFHLLDDPASGQASWEVVLDPAEGYPELGWPVAGDFDGDGDDEVGLFAAGTAYIADDLQGGPPALTLSIGGTVALAGDFDDDGIDTLAGFDVATNTFEWLHHNGAGAATESLSFGHAEPGFWAWAPLTGRWQVPAQPVTRDGYAWQEGDPADHGLDGAQILAALDDAASLADVLGVLVVRHGTLVAERYYHGYDRNIAGNIKSVSKGMLSALYGIALDEGIFASVDDPVAQHLPEYFAELSPAKQQIRLGDLLTMRGGLEWNEGPGYVSGGMVAAPDFCRFVLELPLVETPGTVFEYSTGLTHVASAALTESSGDTTREFARARLLEPLGISTPRWDLSPEGYFVGGAEVWMRPRDMARLGQLYLEGGTLDGQAVLTPEWVELSANPWIPEASGRTYGVWWRERPWASYPAQDSYFAWGYGGQFIFLFPSWDLQVVVTSKWNVSGTASGAAATAIFAFVDQQLLTAVQD